MPEVRLAFSDFWAGFDPHDNVFQRVLGSDRSHIVTSPDDADVLIYGDYGRSHERFVGTKVSYSSEYRKPRWHATDFAIGFHVVDDPRYLRFPLYAWMALEDDDAGLRGPTTPWTERTRFCNFLQTAAGDPMRRRVVERVSQYRQVDCTGKFLHNLDDDGVGPRADEAWRPSKVRYQQQFRFIVACENRSGPGYTTEKLYDALLAGSIPIYWGNPLVFRDFDPAAFVWCRSESDLDRVADLVKSIDNDDALAATYLDAPRRPIVGDAEYADRLRTFFEQVFRYASSDGPRHATARARVVRSRSTAVLGFMAAARKARSALKSVSGSRASRR